MATTSIRGSLGTSLHPSAVCVSSFCAVPGSADLVHQQRGLVRRAIASKLRPAGRGRRWSARRRCTRVRCWLGVPRHQSFPTYCWEDSRLPSAMVTWPAMCRLGAARFHKPNGVLELVEAYSRQLPSQPRLGQHRKRSFEGVMTSAKPWLQLGNLPIDSTSFVGRRGSCRRPGGSWVMLGC